MATQRHVAHSLPSRLPRVEGLGWMMLYVAAALIFLRFILPLRLPGALLTLACALIAAALLGALIAPRLLRRVRASWVVMSPVHALSEATIGAALSAEGGAGPFTLEAWNPTTRRVDAVLRLKGLADTEIRSTWTARFPRRGLVRLPPLVARCDQPFGMLSAGRAISEDAEVLVLPALGSTKRGLHARLRSWLELHATTSADAGDDELAQLREYRPGDAPHSIHWRASARARELLVAERHALGCRRLALVVDCAAEGDGARFERLLSAAATLAHELSSQGWSLTLHGAFAPTGVHGDRDRLLEALALATPDPRPVGEFVQPGMPALVLCLGTPPRLEFEPRPLALPLAEIEQLVHIPSRVR
jgi:uncharacterized protein (DUF58 family)